MNPTKDYEVVVCRWREPWEDVYACFRGMKYMIFDPANKRVTIPRGKFYKFLLGNFGRESAVYLNYILTFRERLKKWTIFSQADPVPHAPDFRKRVRDLLAGGKDQAPAFIPLTFPEMTCNQKGAPHHPEEIPIAWIWHNLFKGECPIRIKYRPGAIFAVHRDLIRMRSEAFYEFCFDKVLASSDPPEGYVLEKLWSYIFDPGEEAKI